MFEEFDILLVEDSPSDVELVREALKEIGHPHRLEVVEDGEKALNTLINRAEKPHMIILDLNLPLISGAEVLRIIKKDYVLKMIPVIVLTNSESQDDVARCYSRHANAYIRKPVGFDELTNAFRSLWDFWMITAVLPKPGVPSPHTIPPASSRG